MKQPPPSKGQVASAIAAATALSVSLTAGFEGLRTRPYYDPAHVLTVCYGETERAMHPYTAHQCLALLKDRQATGYAPALVKCVPGFADKKHRYAFAASIDAAYNAGAGGFCHSRMARAFNVKQWTGGCNLFLGWRATVTVNGTRRVLRGLERRREAERKTCLGES